MGDCCSSEQAQPQRAAPHQQNQQPAQQQNAQPAAGGGAVAGQAAPPPPPTLQQLLQPAFADVTNLPPSWSVPGVPDGVTENTEDENDMGIDIDLSVDGPVGNSAQLAGTVDFARLPPNVRNLRLYGHAGLRGEVAWTQLPQQLRFLSLHMTSFSGAPDFSQLPPNIMGVSMHCSRFSGAARGMLNLPATLRTMTMGGNEGLTYADGDPQELRGLMQHVPQDFEIEA